MKSESEIQQLIVLEAAKYGCILMRNNVGSFIDNNGRCVRFGLLNLSKQQNERIKSSDLIGLYQGRFIAIEVKREGWSFNPKDKREIAQLAFITWIQNNNGLASFCQSTDDFLKLIGK